MISEIARYTAVALLSIILISIFRILSGPLSISCQLINIYYSAHKRLIPLYVDYQLNISRSDPITKDQLKLSTSDYENFTYEYYEASLRCLYMSSLNALIKNKKLFLIAYENASIKYHTPLLTKYYEKLNKEAVEAIKKEVFSI